MKYSESVCDDLLCVLIKDVELIEAEANLDVVADLSGGGRSNSRGDGLTGTLRYIIPILHKI